MPNRSLCISTTPPQRSGTSHERVYECEAGGRVPRSQREEGLPARQRGAHPRHQGDRQVAVSALPARSLAARQLPRGGDERPAAAGGLGRRAAPLRQQPLGPAARHPGTGGLHTVRHKAGAGDAGTRPCGSLRHSLGTGRGGSPAPSGAGAAVSGPPAMGDRAWISAGAGAGAAPRAATQGGERGARLALGHAPGGCWQPARPAGVAANPRGVADPAGAYPRGQQRAGAGRRHQPWRCRCGARRPEHRHRVWPRLYATVAGVLRSGDAAGGLLSHPAATADRLAAIAGRARAGGPPRRL